MKRPMSVRADLLDLAAWFVGEARRLEGVLEIALVGSLCTPKQDPKDIDLLLTLTPGCSLEALARLSRQLKGRTQAMGRGADIFLAERGKYIGRICGFRECHPRRRCRALHCGQRDHLNDDLLFLRLPDKLIADPPFKLWPVLKAHETVPEDTRKSLLEAIA